METVARLFEKYPHICGIKEAGGTPDRVTALTARLGPDFAVTSGDDSLTLPFVSVGATGVVSVAANVFPGALKEMLAAAKTDLAAATKIHARYAPLFSALFVEPNPVPVKFALAEQGILSSPEVRLPLAPLSAPNQDLIRSVLQSLG